MKPLAALVRELDQGRSTSRALVEDTLARIADPHGEGARTFVAVAADRARAEADAADARRRAGAARSPLDGIPISVKDLFDVAGETTRAGSTVLAGEPPAREDAPAVARLRAAGAVVVGRTNMVEFAFGGVGLNPHHGTPLNPWDRGVSRVPGGSSSGAAVAVADGLGAMGLGSDTRGSVRVPAALCGIAGFKPTQRRVPRDGAFPLSWTLDSVGPLAPTIACCAAWDAVLAGETMAPLDAPVRSVEGLRLAVPQFSGMDELDSKVARDFARTSARLERAGATLDRRPMPWFDRHGELFRGGGIAGYEVLRVHAPWLGRIAEYDPRVGKRIELGRALGDDDFEALKRLRAEFVAGVGAAMADADAFVMPTVACVAPTIAAVDASDEAYLEWNARLLRLAGLVNALDGCAATLPCHEPGTAPVGLMVCGVAMADARVLEIARAIEALLAARE